MTRSPVGPVESHAIDASHSTRGGAAGPPDTPSPASEGSSGASEGSPRAAEGSFRAAEGSFSPAEGSLSPAEGSLSPAEGSPGPAAGANAAADEPTPGARVLLRSPVVWIATAGGFGYLPVVPGTFGSAAGVLLFLGLTGLSLPLYGLTVATLCCLGVWAADRAESLFRKQDDGRIVIDEVAGQLVTLTPVLALTAASPDGAATIAVAGQTWWLLVVTAFVVFRLLDIWKPGPIGWAERRFKGGFGVMADDLLAGLFGAILMTLPCYGLLVHRLSKLSSLSNWPGFAG